MGSKEFIERAKNLVRIYTVEHCDKTDDVPEFEVFEVWHCYILGNQKVLMSTTMKDGMYYEITYNAAKQEYYFDAYKKFENRCIRDLMQ